MQAFQPLPSPPEWALSLGVLGRAFIWIAAIAFVVSALAWALSTRRPWLRQVGIGGFVVGSLGLFGAFAVLATFFLNHRFEYEYVWAHSDLLNAVPYRIAGIWAGQQGSFLLWACCSAIWGLLSVRGTGLLRRWYTFAYAMFLAAIAGILAYESPFNLNRVDGLPVVPHDGVGLVPALQNYWVVIHPPVIFLGFGALTVLAAYAFAAMASNRQTEWVPLVRPWAILAMTLVGVGLCLGGFWAYETLGWGGFWMWDPVENVSFVPWIFTAAFVHGLMVQTARKRWQLANLLMGGLPFMLFVYGTFLTRSGLLSDASVHSFAQMDKLAYKLLLTFMGVSTAGFLALWVYRLVKSRRSGTAEPHQTEGLHREGMHRFGTMLLLMTGTATLLGMSVPLFSAISGGQQSVVKEGLYHDVLVWSYVPLMLAMAIAPLLPWRGLRGRSLAKRLYGVVCVTAFLVGISMIAMSVSDWTRDRSAFSPIEMPFGRSVGAVPWILGLVGLSSAIVVGNGWRIAELFKRSKISAAAFMSHVGVAVLMAGLVMSRGFERKAQVMVQEDSKASVLGYEIEYKGMTKSDLKDRENQVVFDLTKGSDKWEARPTFYMAKATDGKDNPVVWPHIEHRPFYDLYLALHPRVSEATGIVNIKLGETVAMQTIPIKYVKQTRDGEPGQLGTAFGALLQVGGGPKPITANPKMLLNGSDPVSVPADLGPHFKVVMKGMNAADNSVALQLLFAKPLYPVELFFKPMTILVWIGTFILGASGLVAAFYRRAPKLRAVAIEERVEVEPAPDRQYAAFVR